MFLLGRSSEASFSTINCKLRASCILSYPATDYRNNTWWLLTPDVRYQIRTPPKSSTAGGTETLQRKETWLTSRDSQLQWEHVKSPSRMFHGILILSSAPFVNQHPAFVNISVYVWNFCHRISFKYSKDLMGHEHVLLHADQHRSVLTKNWGRFDHRCVLAIWMDKTVFISYFNCAVEVVVVE